MRVVYVFLICGLAAVAATAESEGFEPIFNGKDLTGWDGNPKLWTVEEGTIVGRTSADAPLKANTFLIWRAGEVENFILRVAYRIEGGNSGIQYRSREINGVPWGMGGYQADIVAGETISGILYEERGRGILAQLGQKVQIQANGELRVIEQFAKAEDLVQKLHKQDWNQYEITVRGNHIAHKINDTVMSEVIDDQPGKRAFKGLVALQLHQGPPMRVQFKDLQLKRLEAGKEAAASETKGE